MGQNRKWRIYVIHHSHTDIGYTERQEKIEQYHIDFIRQAAKISEDIHSGKAEKWKGFKWTCETFWPVERFLEKASQEEIIQFKNALKKGDIELSGTYLNMTELPDEDILRNNVRKAMAFGKSEGIQIDSAMTADINGYSWGYSQILADSGIKHLLSCVHTHHGMFAIGRKQCPFYWETPQGQRILVWNGEHYMLGNDLGISPGAVLSYSIRDEYQTEANMENHWEMAETRIKRYLNQLEHEGYPYDFALVNVMGLLRDNAAPNGGIMEFIHKWNEKNGEWAFIEMTTPSHFFEVVKGQSEDIPIYKGDWPDWWSDGVASTAKHTQIYREAQRTLRLVKMLDPEFLHSKPSFIQEAESQLTMYAEHTWGYHSSVYEPWHPMVQALEARKEAYASNASRLVFKALDDVLKAKGEALLAPGRPFRYQVVNPYNDRVEDFAYFYLDSWEPDLFEKGMKVVDEDNGEVVPHQTRWTNRGFEIAVSLKLSPNEIKNFVLKEQSEQDKRGITTKSYRLKGNDGIYDVQDLHSVNGSRELPIEITENSVESPFVEIQWVAGKGIVSWMDRKRGRQLLRTDRKHDAFTPVYEKSLAENIDSMAEVRRKMGRNRKGMNVKRATGTLVSAKEITNGPLYAVVELLYQTEGMSYFSLFLKVYADSPRVDVSVRLHKDSVWDPENVYIAMPFGTGDAFEGESKKEQLRLEKSGALIRPGVDQLPGTCIDYYCIQEGLVYTSEDSGLMIATPDTPLVQLGPLEYKKRKVQGQQELGDRQDLYAWILTNYWETNFKATLGGFYEFRYFIQWGEHLRSAEEAIQRCHHLNTGVTSFRLNHFGE